MRGRTERESEAEGGGNEPVSLIDGVLSEGLVSVLLSDGLDLHTRSEKQGRGSQLKYRYQVIEGEVEGEAEEEVG